MPCPTNCGACCQNITISIDAYDRIHGEDMSETQWSSEREDTYDSPAGQQRFLRENWFVRSKGGRVPGAAEIPDDQDHLYVMGCKKFDEVNRRCTVWETRPQVCRGFPFYSREPDYVQYDVCVYQDDVPVRKVLPLVSINGSPA